MQFRNVLKIATLLLAALVVFVLVGCEEAGTTTVDKNGLSVGDVITGGFEVIVDDDEGGYIATRNFDADSEDGLAFGEGSGDEKQALVRGRFGSDVSFSADTVYYLDGAVFIGTNDGNDDATLTIAAGTVVKGETSQNNPGLLVIDRGGKIDAQGTKNNPIVFTSAAPEGERAPGDWGGLVINGWAPVQGGTNTGEGSTGVYGGNDADDSSGILKYVVVQFAGTLFTPENELNGIAFQGVGAGTEVSYIQVHQNADDGVEFFGGSVAVDHIVLTGNQDDSLDFDDGWTGSAQFVVIQQYPGNDYAIEGDGDAEDQIAPASPVLANFTIVGPTGSAGSEATDGGPRFKEEADPDLYNTIIVNYENADPPIREETTTVQYFGVVLEAGTTWTSGATGLWDTQKSSNGNAQVAAGGAATWPNTDHIVDAALTTGSYTFNAKPTSVDAGTAQTVPSTDTHGSTLVDTSYLGAVDPAGTDWTVDGDWLSFPAN